MPASLEAPQTSNSANGIWIVNPLLALVAGLATWGFIEAVHPVFHVPKEFEVANIGAPAEKFEANRLARNRVDRQHAALYMGTLGVLLALALTTVQCVRRRSPLLVLLGLPLGALFGAAGGYAGNILLEYVTTTVGQAELMHTVGMQSTLFAILGFGVGLAYGIAEPPTSKQQTSRQAISRAVAGLVAGALAGVVFSVAISILMPDASTDFLMPTDATSRGLWLGVSSLLIGLTVPAVKGRAAVPASPYRSTAL